MDLPTISRKNIVLIGSTANGKSSLVREILKYGDKHEEANSVKIGDGNLAQTQHCSEFEIQVGLKEYYLRSRTTRDRIELSKQTSHEDVIEDENHLGKWMDLKIVDTPGFSDSGNADEHRLKHSWKFGPDKLCDYSEQQSNERNDSNEDFEEKDERHKLNIFRAMLKLETIHAICFVIRSSQSYSGQLKRVLTALWTAFNATFYQHKSVSYHVIHTEVGYRSRWTQLATNRVKEFSMAFPEFRVTHHFIDNLPISKNPIARYFAKAALAKLFMSFTTVSGANTETLRYPMVPEHEYNDRELRTRLKELEESYRADLAELQEKLAERNHEKKKVSDKIDSFEGELETIQSNINDLDSDEKIHFDTVSCSAEYEVFGSCESTPLIKTSSGLEYPIRWVDWGEGELKKRDGRWIVKEHLPDCLKATLKATSWWTGNVTGYIKLFTYKRDYREEDLKQAKALWEERSNELESERAGSLRLDGEISAFEEQISHAKDAKASFLSDRNIILGLTERRTQIGMLPVKQLADRLHYFTSNTLYAAAAGYNLASKVPKSKLPKLVFDFNMGVNIASIEERSAEISDMLAVTRVALLALKRDLKETSDMIVVLEKMYKKVEGIHNQQKGRITDVKGLVLSNVNAFGVLEVQKERQRMKQKADSVTATVRDAAMSELMLIENHGNAIFQNVKSLRKTVENMEKTVAAWTFEIKWFELWKVAASMTVEMIRETELGIGPYLVLKRAIERGEKYPYAILCVEIWETLKAKALCDEIAEEN